MASPHSGPTAPVFQTEEGRTLSQRNTLRALTKALKKTGVPHVTQHELRHTFASILIAERGDGAYVAEQMGHEKVETTYRIYAHLFNPRERRAEMREKLQASFGGMV